MKKWVVLVRFRDTSYLSIIMILHDEEKAKSLAKFLTDGDYFEGETVTVEESNSLLSNYTILSLLAERTH